MKIIREYTPEQIAAKVKYYQSKEAGVTNVHIYNPILRMGEFHVGMEITFNNKIYKVHSFSDSTKVNLQLLTKEGKIDNRARGIYISPSQLKL